MSRTPNAIPWASSRLPKERTSTGSKGRTNQANPRHSAETNARMASQLSQCMRPPRIRTRANTTWPARNCRPNLTFAWRSVACAPWMRNWTNWIWFAANKKLRNQSDHASEFKVPVTTQKAAGATAVKPPAPTICAAVRVFLLTSRIQACPANVAAATKPSHTNPRFQPLINNQNNAAHAAVSARAVPRTNRNSASVRAFVGTVPHQFSSGVRSQNNASTRMVSGASGLARPPSINPAAAPTTSGTSSSPHAPCSRGTISECRRGAGIIYSLSRVPENSVVTSVTGCFSHKT